MRGYACTCRTAEAELDDCTYDSHSHGVSSSGGGTSASQGLPGGGPAKEESDEGSSAGSDWSDGEKGGVRPRLVAAHWDSAWGGRLKDMLNRLLGRPGRPKGEPVTTQCMGAWVHGFCGPAVRPKRACMPPADGVAVARPQPAGGFPSTICSHASAPGMELLPPLAPSAAGRLRRAYAQRFLRCYQTAKLDAREMRLQQALSQRELKLAKSGAPAHRSWPHRLRRCLPSAATVCAHLPSSGAWVACVAFLSPCQKAYTQPAGRGCAARRQLQAPFSSTELALIMPQTTARCFAALCPSRRADTASSLLLSSVLACINAPIIMHCLQAG